MRQVRMVGLVALAAFAGLAGCKEKQKPVEVTSASSAAPVVVPGTTFSEKAPAVGDKFAQDDATHLTLSLSVDPKGDGHAKKTEMEQSTTTKTHIEITGVEGNTVNKAKIEYVDVTTKSTADGKDTSAPSPLKGKTYVVSSKAGGGFDMRDDKGKFIPAVESTLIEKDFGWVGKPNPVNIPSHPIKEGEPVPELGAAMKAQLEAKKGTTVKSSTATTKSLKAEEGVFTLKVDLTQVTDTGMQVDMSLTGEAHVAVKDGLLREYTMTGPVKITTASGSAKYDGTGTANISRKRAAN